MKYHLTLVRMAIIKKSVLCLVAQSCPTLLQPARLLSPWGFFRKEYWSGLTCRFLGDLPNPGMEPRSPTLQADSLPSDPPGKPIKNLQITNVSEDMEKR